MRSIRVMFSEYAGLANISLKRNEIKYCAGPAIRNYKMCCSIISESSLSSLKRAARLLKTDLPEILLACFLAAIFSLISFGSAFAQTDTFVDIDNCMLCHRYPTLGKYELNGKKKSYYINGEGYANSVHGKRRCTNCHLGLDKIPHATIEKVDCSMICHIENSVSVTEVSHVNVVKKYEASVHGKGYGDNLKPYPEDLPTCTYCHNNRGYYAQDTDHSGPDDSASIFRRPTRQLRSQIDVVELCASCHEDQEKMARHGLETIQTYKDTFHWEALKYATPNAPDCISCHVPQGYSSHTIRHENEMLSSVNIINRLNTCSNQGGVQTCHPGATIGFSSGRVHEYGAKAQLLTGEDGCDSDESLMVKQARNNFPEEEVFHYTVLSIIRVVYKILIGFTIGFMSFHQMLDYIRTRKKQKASHLYL